MEGNVSIVVSQEALAQLELLVRETRKSASFYDTIAKSDRVCGLHTSARLMQAKCDDALTAANTWEQILEEVRS